jgi:hypothetical protein
MTGSHRWPGFVTWDPVILCRPSSVTQRPLLFALHIVSPHANVRPAWFTGTAFSFPLNLLRQSQSCSPDFFLIAGTSRRLAGTFPAMSAQDDHGMVSTG